MMEKLCGITRQDRLAPVYTLCLYHGEKPWDGPLSLRDMISFGADREDMGRFFADYPITLFCVNEQDSFHMFHTELREVFSVMNHRRNKRQLYAVLLQDPCYRTLDAETLKVMSVILNAPGLWNKRDKYISKKESENKEATDKTRTVVLNMLARGMSAEDICAIAECTPEFIHTVMSDPF